MITSLYLEGFKSFGKPVTIEFRDITLLYGENSSGKSSILQAMQYAREVFCNGNLDCLKTEIGGDFDDLRGFRNFVHRRDESQSVKLGITVEIHDEPLAKFCLMDCSAARLFVRWALTVLPMHTNVKEQLLAKIAEFPNATESEYLSLPASENIRKTVKMQVVVKIQSSGNANKTPEITEVTVFLDNEPLMAVTQEEAKSEAFEESDQSSLALCHLFYKHKLIPPAFPDVANLESLCLHDEVYDQFADELGDEAEHDVVDADDSLALNKCRIDINLTDPSGACDDRLNADGAPYRSPKALGALNKVLHEAGQNATSGWRNRISSLAQGDSICWTVSPSCIDIRNLLTFSDSYPTWPLNEMVWEDREGEFEPNDIGDDEKYCPGVFGRSLTSSDLRDLNFLSLYVGSLMIQALSKISDHLSAMRYVGPLRRHYTPPVRQRTKYEDRSWSDGLGAWDYLLNSPNLLATVNKWLSDQSLFGFDCTVQTSANLQDQANEILRQMDNDNADAVRSILKDLDAGERVVIKSKDGYCLNSTDIGVGFSQILPIIVAARGPSPTCILLEQPELHIHVRLQAVLADLLATGIVPGTSQHSSRQFIVETHSEALLLRLMRRIRETTKEIVSNGPRLLCDHVAVYHISKQGGNSIAKKIELDTYGNLTDEWPDDLFDISFKERFGE